MSQSDLHRNRPTDPEATRIARSLLFVPASRPDRFDKALAAGADAVVIDLEDAVPPADKDRARDAVAAWLAPGRSVVVRINGAGTGWFRGDLALCARPGVAAVMLPKAERADQVAALRDAGAAAVMPLIESAAGFAALPAIAGAPGVQRLAFGSIDIQVDLGMRDPLEDELLLFPSQLVLASRLAGLQPPNDCATTCCARAASASAASCASIRARWRASTAISRPARPSGRGRSACWQPPRLRAAPRWPWTAPWSTSR